MSSSNWRSAIVITLHSSTATRLDSRLRRGWSTRATSGVRHSPSLNYLLYLIWWLRYLLWYLKIGPSNKPYMPTRPCTETSLKHALSSSPNYSRYSVDSAGSTSGVGDISIYVLERWMWSLESIARVLIWLLKRNDARDRTCWTTKRLPSTATWRLHACCYDSMLLGMRARQRPSSSIMNRSGRSPILRRWVPGANTSRTECQANPSSMLLSSFSLLAKLLK